MVTRGDFAERVDLLELRRRELGGQALVDFYGVRGVFGTFFEEPDDALGAGFLEPGLLLEPIIMYRVSRVGRVEKVSVRFSK
jgi:hypothetical protein